VVVTVFPGPLSLRSADGLVIISEKENESLLLNNVKSTYLDYWEAFNCKSQSVAAAVIMMMAK